MPITYKQTETSVYGSIPEMEQVTGFTCPVFHSNTSSQANLESGCFDIAFGFKVCWDLSLQNMSAMVELKWNAISLGKWVLDTNHTDVHVGVDIGLASASLDFIADWEQHEIKLKGEVSFMKQIKSFDVVLFKW